MTKKNNRAVTFSYFFGCKDNESIQCTCVVGNQIKKSQKKKKTTKKGKKGKK